MFYRGNEGGVLQPGFTFYRERGYTCKAYIPLGFTTIYARVRLRCLPIGRYPRRLADFLCIGPPLIVDLRYGPEPQHGERHQFVWRGPKWLHRWWQAREDRRYEAMEREEPTV